MIRPATVADVPAIAALNNAFAQRGLMLHRSHAELYENLRNYLVFEETPAQDPPRLLGICALQIVWADLAEVKSLAVDPAHHGRGIGRQLVEAILDEARRLRVARVFALTYEQVFFEKLGFQVVDRLSLPLKVWSDCIKCPKREGCDEIAVLRTLFPTPPVPSDADAEDHPRYEVPTPITQLKVPPAQP